MKTDFLGMISGAMSRIGGIFIRMQTSVGLYIALVLSMAVMGIRSTQFMTRLVNVMVWDLGGVQLSLLGMAIAVALILFVASGSYYAGILPPKSHEQKIAIQLRDIAVFADGLFNMVETIYVVISHNTTAEVLSFFSPGDGLSVEFFVYNIVRIIVILGILGIGLIPTLLAFRSSQLLGALQSNPALAPAPADKPKVVIIPFTSRQRDHLLKVMERLGSNLTNPFAVKGMAAACSIPELELLSALEQGRINGVVDVDTLGRYMFTEMSKDVI